MPDAAAIQSDFRRYASIVESALTPLSFVPTVEDAETLQVERGLVYPGAILGATDFSPIERVLELATSSRIDSIRIVDASRHQRQLYRPLLIYSCLSAFRILYEKLPRQQFGRWEDGLRLWCERIESDLEKINLPQDALPAAQGATFAQAAWIALALGVAGKLFIRDAWTDLSADVFGHFSRNQRASGAFLQATAADNPETHWYHELTILHAAAGYAVQTQDRTLASAVARSTRFHLQETQPDHASQQPWGIFAFLWNEQSRPLADQVLHSATVNGPHSRDAITLMLLADALYCLRLFL